MSILECKKIGFAILGHKICPKNNFYKKELDISQEI